MESTSDLGDEDGGAERVAGAAADEPAGGERGDGGGERGGGERGERGEDARGHDRDRDGGGRADREGGRRRREGRAEAVLARGRDERELRERGPAPEDVPADDRARPRRAP